MYLKESLRQKIMKERKYYYLSFLHPSIIAGMFFGVLTQSVLVFILTAIVFGMIPDGRMPIIMHNKSKSLNELKFLLRTKQRLKKKIHIEIFYQDLSKELQEEALLQLNKNELESFNDADQIHKTTTFKETLVKQYPLNFKTKVLTKLNDKNYLKLLKDVPKTKIDEFLEDRVKKTIA